LNSTLTFERIYLEKSSNDSDNPKTYIEFIINGVVLSELLGGVGTKIGKFGWKTNRKFELQEFNELKSAVNSNLDNGLFSIYVCSECGDEGCGAVMFRIDKTDNHIKWTDFVWSDGYLETAEDPDEKINIDPIIFSTSDYYNALSKLKSMILEK